MTAQGLGGLDWICIVVYAAGLLAISAYHSRKLHRQDDVFLAGRRMSKWPIAFSMYMALFSTNTFLGVTGWLNRPEGTIWIGLKVVSSILAVPVVIWLYPTLFYRLRITSAYEYLDKRFSSEVRSVATVFFIGSRVMWMAIMLYSSSLVVSMMTGWTTSVGASEGQIRAILIMGLLSVSLALLGGMHAVIWTDAMQFFVLLGGLVAMLVYGTDLAGGWSEVVRLGAAEGKFAAPSFFSLTDDLSVVAALLLGFVGFLASGGADQVVLQNYLSAKSDREAKSSLWRSGIFLKPLSLIFPLLGLIMFAYYRKHPDVAAMMSGPDDALPVFVVAVLPPGLAGLMVVAIMSAVLTSIVSGLAALTAALQTDYVTRRGRPFADAEAVRFARMLLLVSGTVITLAALWVRVLGEENNIIQLINIVMYPFSGVLLGVFLLGIVTHRTNERGALTGILIGFVTTVSVPLLKLIAPVALLGTGFGSLLQISNFYYGFIGMMATIVAGYSVSLMFAPPADAKIRGLTRWSLPAEPSAKAPPVEAVSR